MPAIDAHPVLGVAKAIRTDVANSDAAIINIPIVGKGYVVTKVVVYNA